MMLCVVVIEGVIEGVYAVIEDGRVDEGFATLRVEAKKYLNDVLLVEMLVMMFVEFGM